MHSHRKLYLKNSFASMPEKFYNPKNENGLNVLVDRARKAGRSKG
jgi:hypothetical protein